MQGCQDREKTAMGGVGIAPRKEKHRWEEIHTKWRHTLTEIVFCDELNRQICYSRMILSCIGLSMIVVAIVSTIQPHTLPWPLPACMMLTFL